MRDFGLESNKFIKVLPALDAFDWARLIISPFADVRTLDVSGCRLQMKLTRYDNAAAKVTCRLSNIELECKRSGRSEIIFIKVLCGQGYLIEGDHKSTFRKGEFFKLHLSSSWKLRIDDCTVVFLILPCPGPLDKSSSAVAHRTWDLITNRLGFFFAWKTCLLDGGVEFLTRCVTGCGDLRFLNRYIIFTMLLRNVQAGDLQGKQLALDLGVTAPAICSYKLTNTLDVTDYLKQLKSRRRV